MLRIDPDNLCEQMDQILRKATDLDVIDEADFVDGREGAVEDRHPARNGKFDYVKILDEVGLLPRKASTASR